MLAISGEILTCPFSVLCFAVVLISFFFPLIFSPIGKKVSGDGELPITTSDVFVQSGEVSDSSINIMARCNNEEAVTMSLSIDDSEVSSADVDSTTDYTHTFVVDGLSSKSSHTYKVMCGDLESVQASFTTAPAPDDAAAISFVWAADLAGQGFGRNPDFKVVHTDGTTMKGGYVVFQTMEKLAPDFALFQGKCSTMNKYVGYEYGVNTTFSNSPTTFPGDMIYADGAIPPVKNVTNGSEGEYISTWINNPSLDFVAVTLDEFRANWKYNFGDEKMASFLSKVPIFNQWDDHEVCACELSKLTN